MAQLHRFETHGFAEPILWGLAEGYGLSDIAVGLDVREVNVVRAVELWGPEWLAKQVRRAWQLSRDIDPIRAERDWAYRNWARAKLAAAVQLDKLEGSQ